MQEEQKQDNYHEECLKKLSVEGVLKALFVEKDESLKQLKFHQKRIDQIDEIIKKLES